MLTDFPKCSSRKRARSDVTILLFTKFFTKNVVKVLLQLSSVYLSPYRSRFAEFIPLYLYPLPPFLVSSIMLLNLKVFVEVCENRSLKIHKYNFIDVREKNPLNFEVTNKI